MQAIIFDLGGVILDIDISKTNQAFRDIGFRDIDDYFGLGHADSFFLDYEKGGVSDEEFVNKVLEKLENKVGKEAVHKAWNALLLDFPEERIQHLKDLKNRYRLFLYSNTNGIHLDQFAEMYRVKFGGEELDALFEKAYYSHVAGFRKPDSKGYLHILEENQLNPSDTYFIDDALVNVEAANAVGIRGIHLKPGQTILDLDL